jgi:hypothetical protein
MGRPFSTEIFFIDFIKCWIGDPRLSAKRRRLMRSTTYQRLMDRLAEVG